MARASQDARAFRHPTIAMTQAIIGSAQQGSSRINSGQFGVACGLHSACHRLFQTECRITAAESALSCATIPRNVIRISCVPGSIRRVEKPRRIDVGRLGWVWRRCVQIQFPLQIGRMEKEIVHENDYGDHQAVQAR